MEDPADEWADAAVLIGGLSLIDLVGKYEGARGYGPAGGYGFCPARWTLPPSRHFLGEPEFPGPHGKVELLLCNCQSVGCWDFRGRIHVTAEHVGWSDFEQVHRLPGAAGGHWDYSGFGPFMFERKQYEAALAAAGCSKPIAT